jgi:hypothetical protein
VIEPLGLQLPNAGNAWRTTRKGNPRTPPNKLLLHLHERKSLFDHLVSARKEC